MEDSSKFVIGIIRSAGDSLEFFFFGLVGKSRGFVGIVRNYRVVRIRTERGFVVKRDWLSVGVFWIV